MFYVLSRDGPNGRSRRFGQAHRTSAERSTECCALGWNVFYWWAHWASRKCRSK